MMVRKLMGTWRVWQEAMNSEDDNRVRQKMNEQPLEVACEHQRGGNHNSSLTSELHTLQIDGVWWLEVLIAIKILKSRPTSCNTKVPYCDSAPGAGLEGLMKTLENSTKIAIIKAPKKIGARQNPNIPHSLIHTREDFMHCSRVKNLAMH